MLTPPTVLSTTVGSIRILQLNHPKPQNPVNDAMRDALCCLLRSADLDPAVKAIIVTGGVGRSFSVGGDFQEVSQMKSPESVSAWITGLVDMYVAILSTSKPVVMALDGYVIGLGLQLALMGDWRIGGQACRIGMPELKVGVACTLGASILSRSLGRATATRVIFGCDLFTSDDAHAMRLLDELVPSSELTDKAIDRAILLSSYPPVPFSKTKMSLNMLLIEELKDTLANSVRAHVDSFAEKSGDKYMEGILNQNAKNGDSTFK